ncbi:hypothetical protein [Nocardia jejuensis]|uniref:hypothetical protein n=1 Tax=Nocardia jejuensis TaxID=328049 RepID=UPI000829ED1A|nr:hypothetical protein [Nocardia jejuensis]
MTVDDIAMLQVERAFPAQQRGTDRWVAAITSRIERERVTDAAVGRRIHKGRHSTDLSELLGDRIIST